MTEKITKALNDWLVKYEFEVRVLGDYSDFQWRWDTNEIVYSFLAPEHTVTVWNEFLDELGCNYIIDQFFSSFLHEVGHSITYWDFEEDELDEYFDDVAWIQESDESSFSEGSLRTYFNLPVEIAATRWAVRFINDNAEAVRELVNSVQPLIQEYYAEII